MSKQISSKTRGRKLSNDEMEGRIRAKNKKLDYYIRNNHEPLTAKVIAKYCEILPMVALHWDNESAIANEKLLVPVGEIDEIQQNVSAEIDALKSQCANDLAPLQDEINRIKQQIKEIECVRDVAVKNCRNKNAKLLEDRRQIIEASQLDVRERCDQDLYERLVYIVIANGMPYEGLISADDVAKVMERFGNSPPLGCGV